VRVKFPAAKFGQDTRKAGIENGGFRLISGKMGLLFGLLRCQRNTTKQKKQRPFQVAAE
jgi:hypothetical protein